MIQILKSGDSCISNPDIRNLKLDECNFAISDFGFELQESSDFRFLSIFS